MLCTWITCRMLLHLSTYEHIQFLKLSEFLQGFVFVDRDGKHFRHILNWLRDGVVPILKDSEYSELQREAEYYQLLVSGVLVLCILCLHLAIAV